MAAEYLAQSAAAGGLLGALMSREDRLWSLPHATSFAASSGRTAYADRRKGGGAQGAPRPHAQLKKRMVETHSDDFRPNLSSPLASAVCSAASPSCSPPLLTPPSSATAAVAATRRCYASSAALVVVELWPARVHLILGRLRPLVVLLRAVPPSIGALPPDARQPPQQLPPAVEDGPFGPGRLRPRERRRRVWMPPLVAHLRRRPAPVRARRAGPLLHRRRPTPEILERPPGPARARLR